MRGSEKTLRISLDEAKEAVKQKDVTIEVCLTGLTFRIGTLQPVFTFFLFLSVLTAGDASNCERHGGEIQ